MNKICQFIIQYVVSPPKHAENGKCNPGTPQCGLQDGHSSRHHRRWLWCDLPSPPIHSGTAQGRLLQVGRGPRWHTQGCSLESTPHVSKKMPCVPQVPLPRSSLTLGSGITLGAGFVFTNSSPSVSRSTKRTALSTLLTLVLSAGQTSLGTFHSLQTKQRSFLSRQPRSQAEPRSTAAESDVVCRCAGLPHSGVGVTALCTPVAWEQPEQSSRQNRAASARTPAPFFSFTRNRTCFGSREWNVFDVVLIVSFDCFPVVAVTPGLCPLSWAHMSLLMLPPPAQGELRVPATNFSSTKKKTPNKTRCAIQG